MEIISQETSTSINTILIDIVFPIAIAATVILLVLYIAYTHGFDTNPTNINATFQTLKP